jgi:hypothetical protein
MFPPPRPTLRAEILSQTPGLASKCFLKKFTIHAYFFLTSRFGSDKKIYYLIRLEHVGVLVRYLLRCNSEAHFVCNLPL